MALSSGDKVAGRICLPLRHLLDLDQRLQELRAASFTLV